MRVVCDEVLATSVSRDSLGERLVAIIERVRKDLTGEMAGLAHGWRADRPR